MVSGLAVVREVQETKDQLNHVQETKQETKDQLIFILLKRPNRPAQSRTRDKRPAHFQSLKETKDQLNATPLVCNVTPGEL